MGPGQTPRAHMIRARWLPTVSGPTARTWPTAQT